MKIEKGVKTRPQYNFLIKSYDKKGTSCQIEKINIQPNFIIYLYLYLKYWHMIIKIPIGIIVVYDFIMKTPSEAFKFSQ